MSLDHANGDARDKGGGHFSHPPGYASRNRRIAKLALALGRTLTKRGAMMLPFRDRPPARVACRQHQRSAQNASDVVRAETQTREEKAE